MTRAMRKRRSRRGVRLAVIDATLLRRLLHVDLLDALAATFHQIHVPLQVEIEARRAPEKMGKRLRRVLRKSKFLIRCPHYDEVVFSFLLDMPDMHAGESEALAQADFLRGRSQNVILLIDEMKGVSVASKMRLPFLRTGALLLELKQAALIEDVKSYLDRLRARGFWLDDSVYLEILRTAGEHP